MSAWPGARLLTMASVRLQLTLLYTLMLAATLVVLGAALYFLLVRTLAGEADSDVSITTLTVSRAVGTRLDPSSGRIELQVPELTVLGDNDTFVQVVDLRTGQVLSRSATLILRDVPAPQAPFPTGSQSGGQYQTYDGETGRYRVFSRPIFLNGDAVGMVQAARSLNSDDRLLSRLRLLLAVVAILGVPSTAAVGWVLAGRTLRPIAEANSRFADANARLERSLSVQRRFLADASHELRTPLTTIRANAEVLRWTSARADPDQQQALADLGAEAERMSRLVEGLLTLARTDAGQRRPVHPIRLRPLLDDAIRQAQLLARGHRLTLATTEDVCVLGNPDALHQLVLILVDNALKYTPQDGTVTLDLERDGQVARLSVSDTGVGMSAENIGHIFEPFYRADTAREIGGSGLGLAIARSIVEEHGGYIEVSSQPGTGSTFTVLLPALESTVVAESEGCDAQPSQARQTRLHASTSSQPVHNAHST